MANNKLQLKKLYALSSENRKFSFSQSGSGKGIMKLNLNLMKNTEPISYGRTAGILLRLFAQVKTDMRSFLTILVTLSQ
jgi:hypothetical protein